MRTPRRQILSHGAAVAIAAVALASAGTLMARQAGTPQPPAVGQRAPGFTLTTVDGASVTLADQIERGPVVLVVGRGWVGYQCPFCTRQFGDFLRHAGELEAAGARVLWVYPGPADGLGDHAREVTEGQTIPAGFSFLLDPGYTFTVAYGLRWDAPAETAYPSTFVIDREGVVRFANISRTHDGRTPASEVLSALAAIAQ